MDTFSETVPRGVVIDTDPTAGTKVPDGGSITAMLSQGPERYGVPKVVGLSKTNAVNAIEEAHLVVGTVSESYWTRAVAAPCSRPSISPARS